MGLAFRRPTQARSSPRDAIESTTVIMRVTLAHCLHNDAPVIWPRDLLFFRQRARLIFRGELKLSIVVYHEGRGT